MVAELEYLLSLQSLRLGKKLKLVTQQLKEKQEMSVSYTYAIPKNALVSKAVVPGATGGLVLTVGDSGGSLRYATEVIFIRDSRGTTIEVPTDQVPSLLEALGTMLDRGVEADE